MKNLLLTFGLLVFGFDSAMACSMRGPFIKIPPLPGVDTTVFFKGKVVSSDFIKRGTGGCLVVKYDVEEIYYGRFQAPAKLEFCLERETDIDDLMSLGEAFPISKGAVGLAGFQRNRKAMHHPFPVQDASGMIDSSYYEVFEAGCRPMLHRIDGSSAENQAEVIKSLKEIPEALIKTFISQQARK